MAEVTPSTAIDIAEHTISVSLDHGVSWMVFTEYYRRWCTQAVHATRPCVENVVYAWRFLLDAIWRRDQGMMTFFPGECVAPIATFDKDERASWARAVCFQLASPGRQVVTSVRLVNDFLEGAVCQVRDCFTWRSCCDTRRIRSANPRKVMRIYRNGRSA